MPMFVTSCFNRHYWWTWFCQFPLGFFLHSFQKRAFEDKWRWYFTYSAIDSCLSADSVSTEGNDRCFRPEKWLTGLSCFILVFSCIWPPVLWRCWLGSRKAIRPVKTGWWGADVVMCLERGADLHMAQLMPLPLTVFCFSKIQIGFTFLVPAYPGIPGKRAVKCECVCVCYYSFTVSDVLFVVGDAKDRQGLDDLDLVVKPPPVWNV